MSFNLNADSLKRKVNTISSSVGAAIAAGSNTARQSASTASRTLPRAWRPPVVGGIDSIVSDLIYQAGVDFETRPIVVVCASAFPDPGIVSYDEILNRILTYLDAYVESDYTVVLFTAGARFQPSWNWIWKAYKSLNRKYRKNLKKMFVVHSSWFFRMLFSIAGSVISPKFFRKIVYLSTLSELAEHVPLQQLVIPEEVYEENRKHETNIVQPSMQSTRMFGVPLETLMGDEGGDDLMPAVVADCVDYLRASGLDTPGLFRRSPSSALLNQFVKAYDRGRTVEFEDPHIAAVLLKKFLRDLPSPIFPETMYDRIRRCPRRPDVDVQVEYIQKSILSTVSPRAGLTVLGSVIGLLYDVSLRADTNLMDARNLALVLAPTLIRGSNPMKDIEMCGIAPESSTVASVLEICISQYPKVFKSDR